MRLEDPDDVVPKLSMAMFTARADYTGATKRTAGYGVDKSGAHNISYKRTDVWGAFDALGTENGGAVLRLNLASLVTLDI